MCMVLSNMADSTSLYPVLSSAKVKRPTEADRRLPSWLSTPTRFPAVNLLESGQDIDEFEDYIDDDLRRYLKKNMLIERLFPVQKCLIPNLVKQFRSRSYRRPNDVCVSSPTGSGKTLAFAIPIVNHLKQKLTRSLRALTILPSRDLAQQVFKAFYQVCTPTHLRCALATGDASDMRQSFFRKLNPKSNESGGLNPNSILQNQCMDIEKEDEYVSTIDILVSTPGVLVDLIHNHPGFSLADLEILVIDEADRLMTSHKHDWLNTIEKSIFPDGNDECFCDSGPNKKRRLCFSSITGCSIKHAYAAKPLHKLLFSATLSSDPQLLTHINLYQPRLYLATKPSIAGTRISQNSPIVNTRSELLTSTAIPEQLEEKMFITEAKEKLFIIWYLFHELKFRKVICFANQIQTSFRLCKFLNEVHDVRAVEFSSNMKPETRQKYLNEFKLEKIDVIVSTDLMARGMDVEGVEHVISYDMPPSEVFYVHRVGRTARAGKKGTAITLVDTKQLVQFKKIVQLAHKMPNSMRLNDLVEEMKVQSITKKSADKYGLYLKTFENYEDKLNSLAKKSKIAHR